MISWIYVYGLIVYLLVVGVLVYAATVGSRVLPTPRVSSRRLQRLAVFASVISILLWAGSYVIERLVDDSFWHLASDVLSVPAGIGALSFGVWLVSVLRASVAIIDGSEDGFSAVSHSSDVIFTLDANGVVETITPSCYPLLGYRMEEMVGHRITRFVVLRALADGFEVWRDVAPSDEPTPGKTVVALKARSGDVVHQSALWRIRRDDEGRFAGVEGILRDVDQSRDAKEAMTVHARKMENLFSLALAMGSSLDLDHLLDRLLQIVQEAIGYDSSTVFVEDERTGKYRALSRRGYADDHPALSIQYDEIAVDTLKIMRDTLKPMVIPDTRNSPIWQRTEATSYINSWLGAPLVVRDRVIGTINLNSSHANHYGDSDVQLIASIASQASAAIDNARLFARVQEQASHLTQLNAHLVALQEASLKMAEAASVQDVLQIVQSAVHRLVGDNASTFFGLIDEEYAFIDLFLLETDASGQADAKAPWGLPGNGSRLSLEGAPAHLVKALWSHQPLIAHHLSELLGHLHSPEDCHRIQQALGIHTFVQFSLWSRGRPTGTFSVALEADQIDVEALDLLEALSNMAAVAIDNARLMDNLRSTSSALDDIITSSTDAIITLDCEQVISTWNPAAGRILGMDAETVMGQAVWELTSPDERSTNDPLFQRVLTGEAINLPEWEQTLADGKTIWLIGAASPIRNSDGDITGALVTLRDVTRERLIKRQMAQTEKLSALGQLVAGVAHELNNPLTSVIGFGQLLRTQPLDEEGQRDIERIVEEAKRAARIVRNLLVFARDHEPAWSDTDVNAILSSVVEMRGYEMRLLDVSVEMNLAPDLPVVRADPHQLHQVFLNLVINAEQAMESVGGGRLTVSTWQENSHAIRITLRDTGPGISPEDMKQIFDPFFTTKEVGKGTGMGLSICYGIVEEHGGRIWAENCVGQGAIFIVELPVHSTSPVIAGEAAPGQSESVGEPSPALPTGERILVVDDEETITDMIGQMLQRWGYAVNVASSGDVAWQLIERGQYDLILSDLRMPGMSGQSLLDRLQEMRPEQVGRIVFMTGDTASPDAARFLAECGRPALKKPFELERLRAFIEEMLSEGRSTAG